MTLQRNQPSTTSLEIVSLGMGILFGGTAALILVWLLLLAGLSLPSFTLNIPGLLPVNWQEAIIAQAAIMGFPLQAETSAYWYMSRVSGLLGYFFVWGATLWGLLLSTKIVKSALSPALAFSIHEFLSLLGLGFAAFHAFILLGDQYINFSLSDILLPFSGSYKPGWVGLGVISLYLYGLTLLSFYIKKRIGHKVWRIIHCSTFALYLMIVAHSLMLGTDSAAPAVSLMYLTSAASILFLTCYRILSS